MLSSKLKKTVMVLTVTVVLGGFGPLTPQGQPAKPAPPMSKGSASTAKKDLTPENFVSFHDLIRPHKHEWRHLRVHWLTDVVAARKKAAAEDKPIVICYTGGAGYNEPLGIC